MAKAKKKKVKVNCPCCAYPTLTSSGTFEICHLCDWEDDGQRDETGDEVWGFGPNGQYSLAEARKNFEQYRVMYSPGKDPRVTGADTPFEFETKGLLMDAYQRLKNCDAADVAMITKEISQHEQALRESSKRQIKAYERQLAAKANKC